MRWYAFAPVIVFSVLALTSAYAQDAPAKQQSLAPLTVVDARGKTVGRWMSAPGAVYMTINNKLVGTGLHIKDNLPLPLYFDRRNIFFANADCTGAAYIEPIFSGVRSAVIAPINGRVLAYVSTGAPYADTSFRSFANYDFQVEAYICAPFESTFLLLPASAVNITGTFTEPLTVR